MTKTIKFNVLFFLLTLFSASCVQEEVPNDIQDAICDNTQSTINVSCDTIEPVLPGIPKSPTIPNTPSAPEETNKSSFYSPWKKSNSTIVIDAYEGNSIDWNAMAIDDKVAAVIHRSSIGTRVDTQYLSRKKTALARGYLWGAYHLGRRGNTIAQANVFLSLVKDEPNTLMILDLEDTGSTSFMSIDESIIFMEYVYEKTGRIPVVYANHSTTKALNIKVKSHPLFQQAKLWYARFTSTVTDYPAVIWPNYFLWQFSSEINCSSTGPCLYNVPGTKYDMDVNVYNGSASELASEWNND